MTAATNYSGDDFYCDVALRGVVPLNKEYESEQVLAYHHTRPFWETHIVVIPKVHVNNLLTVENDLLIELLDVVRKVASDVLSKENAARVLTNLGDYQDSKHLHFHVNSGALIR